MAFALHNLGGFYLLRKKLDQAAEAYEEVGVRCSLQPSNSGAGAASCSGPQSLGAAARPALVLRLSQHLSVCDIPAPTLQALKVKLEVLGPGHSETSNTLFHLAEVRWRQDRKADAAALLQQSLGEVEGCRRQ